MEFINRDRPIKIRIGKSSNCHWTTIKKGEVVNLTLEKGLAYGFSIKTTEGQIGNKKVETKQIDVVNDIDDFFKELCSINGIGKKTAEDIVSIFQKKDNLIKVIKSGTSIPIRDDIEKILRERYDR